MTVLAVIPARHRSTRFPGKPLALIAGRPMVCHVWDRVAATPGIDEIVVATDDERIGTVCAEHGMAWLMTSPDHETGTDRVAEVASLRPADVYVNVQGDEPLVPPEAVAAVVRCLLDALPEVEVSTGYATGATEADEASLSVVHLVPTTTGRVLTFSRLAVPAGFREGFVRNVHLGLYAFTGDALRRFASWGPGPVERAESIELLRFLERGEPIACVAVEGRTVAVDHPEDVARVERALEGG